jgi:hypothetical protein
MHERIEREGGLLALFDKLRFTKQIFNDIGFMLMQASGTLC